MAASETTTFVASEKTVATAGTSEPLSSSSQRVKSLTLIAKAGNTSQVYVGGSDVSSTTNDGLAAGESLSIPAISWLDLNNVYIDVDTNGEGIDFYAVKANPESTEGGRLVSILKWPEGAPLNLG